MKHILFVSVSILLLLSCARSPSVVCQSRAISNNTKNLAIFDIALATRFSLKECNNKLETPCFERGKEKVGVPVCNETVSIRLPESPEIVKGSELLGLITDGNLESIAFDTPGYYDQAIVLNELKQKFGEPNVYQPRTMTDSFGVSFSTFTAEWNTDSVVVTFHGIFLRQAHTGLVTINTAKAKQLGKDRSRRSPFLTSPTF